MFSYVQGNAICGDVVLLENGTHGASSEIRLKYGDMKFVTVKGSNAKRLPPIQLRAYCDSVGG